MKIGEARALYRAQIQEYREQQQMLIKQKTELEKKKDYDKNSELIYANEAATLELTIQAVEEKKTEYQEYMDKLMLQWSARVNMESAKQQGEAAEEYIADMGKIMEVARRLMKGAIVPPTDEKKLMDYSMELYQAAKNIGSMEKQRKKEEYDSLWKEEEKRVVTEDPFEAADQAEAFAKGPEIVEVSQIVQSLET